MKVAKPLLLVSTPVGVAAGLHAAWTHAGGLVFLMAAMVAVMGCAIGSVVYTIRREEREERERRDRMVSGRSVAVVDTALPAVHDFERFPADGKTVSNEDIDKLRDRDGV